MSAAIDALVAALSTRAATITDELTRLEAQALIPEYAAIRAAVLALSGSQVTSYSLAGRSVTRADLRSLRAEANSIRDQITECFNNGQILIADLSEPIP